MASKGDRLCPQCKKPMGGGCGGFPWTCFRVCQPKKKPGQLYPDREPPEPDNGHPCPVCTKPMHGGRGGMPWTCFRKCLPIYVVDRPPPA